MSVPNAQTQSNQRKISESTERMAKILGVEFERKSRWDAAPSSQQVQLKRA